MKIEAMHKLTTGYLRNLRKALIITDWNGTPMVVIVSFNQYVELERSLKSIEREVEAKTEASGLDMMARAAIAPLTRGPDEW